jgi:hypothetical protein
MAGPTCPEPRSARDVSRLVTGIRRHRAAITLAVTAVAALTGRDAAAGVVATVTPAVVPTVLRRSDRHHRTSGSLRCPGSHRRTPTQCQSTDCNNQPKRAQRISHAFLLPRAKQRPARCPYRHPAMASSDDNRVTALTAREGCRAAFRPLPSSRGTARVSRDRTDVVATRSCTVPAAAARATSVFEVVATACRAHVVS